MDSAGGHLNDTGFTPGTAYHGDWPSAKVDYQKGFKFSIAMENSSSLGYTTEKIVHALAAGTIPIYFGNPNISSEFNSGRFINCHQFQSISEVIELVLKLDSYDSLYLQMVNAPFFPRGVPPENLTESYLLDCFEMIFEPPKAHAYRRNFHAWGPVYESRYKRLIAGS